MIITFISAVVIMTSVILWAAAVRLRAGRRFDAFTYISCGTFVLINYVTMWMFANGIFVPMWGESLLTLSKILIVPIGYAYFSRQMGRPSNNAVLFIVWFLALNGFIPNWISFIGGDNSGISDLTLKDHRFHLISHGRILLNIHLADLVIALQALATVFRVIPTYAMARRYGLTMTRKMLIFTTWWIVGVLFIIVSSTLSIKQIATPAGQWFYFGSVFLICTVVFVMFGLGLDVDPFTIRKLSSDERKRQEEDFAPAAEEQDTPAEEEIMVPGKIDTFILQCHEMAASVRHMLFVDKVWKNPDFKADDAVRMLGTNRTYFSRMMNAEFGCTFTDLLNRERLSHAKEMLENTHKTVAEISEECGFSSPSYFSRKYSAAYGKAPSDDRRS